VQNRIYDNNQEMERIIDKQRYPIEANDDLKILAAEFPKIGIFEIIIKAFNLGLIYGKRIERRKEYKCND